MGKKKKVMWMREAEIKHARLAMMAAAGWPLSELLDRPLSQVLGQPYLLEATGGRAPSVFNGHLFEGPPGAFGFDPLGMYGQDESQQKKMQLSEIKHGRTAMLAVTGFAVQEFFYGKPVVEQTPNFFKPFFL